MCKPPNSGAKLQSMRWAGRVPALTSKAARRPVRIATPPNPYVRNSAASVNIALKAYAFALDEAAGRGKDGSTEAIEAALADAPEIDGFTGLQRFFLSYASIWRTKNRDELAEQYLQIDPHSPAECRTNGIARNVDLFHKAFGVQPGDGMWLAPEQRVRIW